MTYKSLIRKIKKGILLQVLARVKIWGDCFGKREAKKFVNGLTKVK